MPQTDTITPEQELHEAIGALDVLFTLREEFAQWLEEAQDEARREELQNVYRHVAAMEEEFERRRARALQKLKPS
jgi:mannitol-1-phosphate/altronate dehydrogenase